jgi:hypothetical protein
MTMTTVSAAGCAPSSIVPCRCTIRFSGWCGADRGGRVGGRRSHPDRDGSRRALRREPSDTAGSAAGARARWLDCAPSPAGHVRAPTYRGAHDEKTRNKSGARVRIGDPGGERHPRAGGAARCRIPRLRPRRERVPVRASRDRRRRAARRRRELHGPGPRRPHSPARSHPVFDARGPGREARRAARSDAPATGSPHAGRGDCRAPRRGRHAVDPASPAPCVRPPATPARGCRHLLSCRPLSVRGRRAARPAGAPAARRRSHRGGVPMAVAPSGSRAGRRPRHHVALHPGPCASSMYTCVDFRDTSSPQ